LGVNATSYEYLVRGEGKIKRYFSERERKRRGWAGSFGFQSIVAKELVGATD